MELQTPLFAKSSTYSVLEKAVAEGKLSTTQRAVYCFIEDTGKLYRVDADKTIKPIVGENASQVERVDTLPPVAAGNTSSLYILGNVVYTFDGEAYYPTYQAITEAIDTLTETVIGFDEDITRLKSDVSNLEQTKANADSVYSKGEVDTLLTDKADVDSVYSKGETDTLLNAKADADSVYTKSEADILLAEKASAVSVYTKDETDVLLDAKADSDTVYTKTEVDDMMGGIVDPSGQTVTVQEYVDNAAADAKQYTDDAIALIIV